MDSSTKDDRRLTYDIVEAGRLLGLGRNASYDAAKTKQIPTIKVGAAFWSPKRH